MRLSWGQKLSVLASRVEGICESLDNTTLSWFKLLNLLVIMRSPQIQTLESILRKEGVFPGLQQCLGHCIVCLLSLCPADPCWADRQACCSLFSVLNP